MVQPTRMHLKQEVAKLSPSLAEHSVQSRRCFQLTDERHVAVKMAVGKLEFRSRKRNQTVFPLHHIFNYKLHIN